MEMLIISVFSSVFITSLKKLCKWIIAQCTNIYSFVFERREFIIQLREEKYKTIKGIIIQ